MKTKHICSRSGAKVILPLLSTVTLLAAAPAVWADSPSDLMEQGIYSEETKGDLDNAVQLYQKVVEQAKADQTLAARAQYHLGLCYYKENNYTAANAAFESLVKDFPEQKEMVALARKYLAAAHPLQPAPWTDNEDMRLDIKMGTMRIGVMDVTVASGQTTNGQKTWRFGNHMTIGGIQSVSHVEADAETMSPIRSRWKHTLLGEVDAVYYPDHADLKTVGKDGTKTVNFTTPVMDNEEAIQWMRRLPLADGYTNGQPVLSTLVATTVPITWSVSGPESVLVPAGSYNCYKVELSINQTFWISSAANHYVAKFEGGGVIGELARVTHQSPGEQSTYTDASNGISMTGPAGWTFDKAESEIKGRADVRLIDPDGSTASSVTVGSMDLLTAAEKKSVRDYANVKVEKAGKMHTDFQVRSNSWTDLTVAGQPAVSVIADFTEGKSKKVGYGVWSFGANKGIYFEMITSAKDYEAMRPQMDAIINSFKLQ